MVTPMKRSVAFVLESVEELLARLLLFAQNLKEQIASAAVAVVTSRDETHLPGSETDGKFLSSLV